MRDLGKLQTTQFDWPTSIFMRLKVVFRAIESVKQCIWACRANSVQAAVRF